VGHKSCDFGATVCKMVRPILSDRLSVSDDGVLWLTVGWIKMPRGMEVGLSPGHIVLDGNQSPPQKGSGGSMGEVKGRSPSPDGHAPAEKNATPSTFLLRTKHASLLRLPYVTGQAIIFLPCGFFFLLSFFSSPNLSRRRLDVYHTSTHSVALVRI